MSTSLVNLVNIITWCFDDKNSTSSSYLIYLWYDTNMAKTVWPTRKTRKRYVKCSKGCRETLPKQTLAGVAHVFLTSMANKIHQNHFLKNIFLVIFKIAMNPKHSQKHGPLKRRRHHVYGPYLTLTWRSMWSICWMLYKMTPTKRLSNLYCFVISW